MYSGLRSGLPRERLSAPSSAWPALTVSSNLKIVDPAGVGNEDVRGVVEEARVERRVKLLERSLVPCLETEQRRKRSHVVDLHVVFARVLSRGRRLERRLTRRFAAEHQRACSHVARPTFRIAHNAGLSRQLVSSLGEAALVAERGLEV